MARTSQDPLDKYHLEFIPGKAEETRREIVCAVRVTQQADLRDGAPKRGAVQGTVWFHGDESGLRIERLEFFGSPIKSEDTRLPLGAIQKWAVQRIKDHPPIMSIGALTGDAGQRAAVDKAFESIKFEPGQVVRNDEHWAWIAETYLEGCRVYPNEPIIYLKEKLEAREIFWSRGKVADEKERAKQLGWLVGRNTPGKAGADPGPKLIQRRKDHEE